MFSLKHPDVNSLMDRIYIQTMLCIETFVTSRTGIHFYGNVHYFEIILYLCLHQFLTFFFVSFPATFLNRQSDSSNQESMAFAFFALIGLFFSSRLECAVTGS